MLEVIVTKDWQGSLELLHSSDHIQKPLALVMVIFVVMLVQEIYMAMLEEMEIYTAKLVEKAISVAMLEEKVISAAKQLS
jgi:antibiotic biosynthesis monooxygenase (ABM) superfamily enzyme